MVSRSWRAEPTPNGVCSFGIDDSPVAVPNSWQGPLHSSFLTARNVIWELARVLPSDSFSAQDAGDSFFAQCGGLTMPSHCSFRSESTRWQNVETRLVQSSINGELEEPIEKRRVLSRISGDLQEPLPEAEVQRLQTRRSSYVLDWFQSKQGKMLFMFLLLLYLCVDSSKVIIDAWALSHISGGAFLIVFLQNALSSVAGLGFSIGFGGISCLREAISPREVLRFFPAAVCFSLSQAALAWAYIVGLNPATGVVLGFLYMPVCALMSRCILLRRYGWLDTLALTMLMFCAFTFAELRNNKMERQSEFFGKRAFIFSISSTLLAACASLMVEQRVKEWYNPTAAGTRYYVQKTRLDLGSLVASFLALAVARGRDGHYIFSGWNDRMYLALFLRVVQSWMGGFFAKHFSTTAKAVVQCLSFLVIYFIGDIYIMELHGGEPLKPYSKEFTVSVLAVVVALTALLYQIGRDRTTAENPGQATSLWVLFSRSPLRESVAPPDFNSFSPAEFESIPSNVPRHSTSCPRISGMCRNCSLLDRAWIEHQRRFNVVLSTWLSSFVGKSTQVISLVFFIVSDASRTIVNEHVFSSSSNVTPQTMVVTFGAMSIVLGLSISVALDGWDGLRGATDFFDVLRSIPVAACFSLSQTATALAYSFKISGAVNNVLGYFYMPLSAILTKCILGRSYTSLEWLALVLITLSAVVFVTLMGDEGMSAVPIEAICCSLGAVIFACVASLLAEKLFKANDKPYYQQKTYLDISAIFTSVSMLFIVPLIDKRPTAAFWNGREVDGIMSSGFFVGWNGIVVASVVVTLLHSWMGGLVSKRLSSVTKAVAQCLSLLVVYFVGELVVKGKPFKWPVGSVAIVVTLSVLVFTWSKPARIGSENEVRATDSLASTDVHEGGSGVSENDIEVDEPSSCLNKNSSESR